MWFITQIEVCLHTILQLSNILLITSYPLETSALNLAFNIITKLIHKLVLLTGPHSEAPSDHSYPRLARELLYTWLEQEISVQLSNGEVHNKDKNKVKRLGKSAGGTLAVIR
jgi:hypothetical protein